MSAKNASYIRGLDIQFIETLKKSKIIDLAHNPENDLFLGIRNGYFNLYYQCASAGKFTLNKGKLMAEIADKYLKPDQTAPTQLVKLSEQDFYEQFVSIIEGINQLQKDVKKEKKAQQKIILNNNRNEKSKWFCIDLEYVMQRVSSEEQSYGRFDIVALSKEKINGQYQAALIELKVGSGRYSTSRGKKSSSTHRFFEEYEKGQFCIDTFDGSLGSGLLGHLADFYRFENNDQFKKHMKGEICSIVSNLKELGLCGFWPNGICASEISDTPQIYILTLESNSAVKESFARYMLNDGPLLHGSKASKYNVQKVLNSNFLDSAKYPNYHFLFAECDGSDIMDIIDYDKYTTLY